MCTVSVVPTNRSLVFTFNRDEQPTRYTDVFVQETKLANKTIFYAKDSKKGGSWFAVDSLGNIAMLFNGAFVTHTKQEQYTQSRGAILLDVISADHIIQQFEKIDLTDVEPFSMVVYENETLQRLTWDGARKTAVDLNTSKEHIFSSATLYTPDVFLRRLNWLYSYLDTHTASAKNMLHFHANYKADDTQNGLIINRPQGCQTLSISQAEITKNAIILKHIDLKTNQTHTQTIALHENKVLIS
jgi:hypothetical protein